MARTKGGVKGSKRRKYVIAQTKGYRFARSKKKRSALEAIKHAGVYAFRDRRAKKREMRKLQTVHINAALRERGYKNYSTFIGALKKAKIELDRKVLDQLAGAHPETFDRLLKKIA